MLDQDFILNDHLKNDCYEILDLKLSKVLLYNNSYYPWIILVPRINNISELFHLSYQQQITLLEEINLLSQVLKEIYNFDKLNIATFGNIISQLHIHIIARFKNDKSWPNPTFGKDKKPYSSDEKHETFRKLIYYINVNLR